MCFLEKVREKFDLHIEINGMVRDFLYTSTYDERSCFILFLIMITYYFRNKKILIPRFFFHSSFRATLDLKIRKKV